jgi:hypothetical protein
MAFPVQPSKKRKKIIGRRQKNGNSYAAYRTTFEDTALNGAPQDVPNPAAGEAAAEPAADISSGSDPKKRKDDNWRVSRAVKSATRKIAKAVSERNAAQEDSTRLKNKLRVADARVKQVEHEQYLGKKAARTQAIETEEEHKFAVSELMERYCNEIEEAQASVEIETAKRIAEEELRIKSDLVHADNLRKERGIYANKLEKERSKLTTEKSGQNAVIDHLHEQWKLKLAATRLKAETTKMAENAKLMKKLKKKDEKMELAVSENENR